MLVKAFDHIVLCVADVEATCRFYERILGMEPREEKPGKWSLHFGVHKISLQDAARTAELARKTTPGSCNFCLLTDVPLDQVITHLGNEGVTIVEGPDKRIGAVGTIRSVYFRDPDGNLVEVSNQV
jgi:catechol 2,3-dioxygenase-like lactoylglutathione lyase family enzyme